MKVECPWVYREEEEAWRCPHNFYDSPDDTAVELLAAHLILVHGVSPDFATRVTQRWVEIAKKEAEEK
jgi:hypothetical protein